MAWAKALVFQTDANDVASLTEVPMLASLVTEMRHGSDQRETATAVYQAAEDKALSIALRAYRR
jgi:hypothetical protein